MLYKIGNKIVKQGAKLGIKRFNELIFTVDGTEFPKDVSTFVKNLTVRSSVPNTVTIDWGDGTIDIVDFSPLSGDYIYILTTHTYTDGNSGFRDVKFTFENTEGIYDFFALRVFLGGFFPKNILKFNNLEEISINQFSGIKEFPSDLSSLQKLKSLYFQNVEFGKIPASILPLNIETLTFVNCLDLSDITNSNFDLLVNLKDTLVSLRIPRNNIIDFPANFSQLTNLEYLKTSFPIGGELTQPIYDLPNLKVFNYGRSDGVKPISFANFEHLTTLENIFIDVKNTTSINCSVANFGTLVNLTTLRITGSLFDSQTNIDTFINTLYDVFNVNALKATGSTPFRNMLITCTNDNDVTSPTGTYQQPTGYVADSNNGTPASPKEKIWLLVNQYNCTITYTN